MNTAPLFFLSVLAVCLQGAWTLRCVTCSSELSNEDCMNNAENRDCRSVLNRCIKLHYRTDTTQLWKRECSSGSNCDKKESCPIGYRDCKIDCCSSNYCNSGYMTRSTIFWIFATALGASMYTFFCS